MQSTYIVAGSTVVAIYLQSKTESGQFLIVGPLLYINLVNGYIYSFNAAPKM